ncbi:tetratricopeptide repeat protein [Myxococcus sp. K15C18031901]|uniref:tetratricopeptide repeat protein n=1 Tax=Myxococcus dinghuensis TaxID=2906761 RepID=UPI0020A7A034|nr:tetratricopeptide repeat protein [Myxococcus dinghuensis]MCP3103292.1 tetratricopeptide repeat protein [Myxococcus dinghuensis]
MAEIPDDVYEQLQALCARGDGLAEEGAHGEALASFQEALGLIPEPRVDFEATTWVCTALGDTYFQLGDHARALAALQDAVRAPDGLGNPFIHLRLGQCQFELGDLRRAADELARAYLGAGEEIFEDDDEKYLRFIQTRLRPPRDA